MYLQEKGFLCWLEDQKQKVVLILTFMRFVLAEEHLCALQVPGRYITKDSCDGGRRIFFLPLAAPIMLQLPGYVCLGGLGFRVIGQIRWRKTSTLHSICNGMYKELWSFASA